LRIVSEIQALAVNTDTTSEDFLVMVGNLVKKRNFGSIYLKSIGVNIPNIFQVATPINAANSTLQFSLVSQGAKTVFAAPFGANGTPTFRQLSSADLSDASSLFVLTSQAAKTVMAAPSGVAGLPTFRQLSSADLSDSGSGFVNSSSNAFIQNQFVSSQVANANIFGKIGINFSASGDPYELASYGTGNLNAYFSIGKGGATQFAFKLGKLGIGTIAPSYALQVENGGLCLKSDNNNPITPNVGNGLEFGYNTAAGTFGRISSFLTGIGTFGYDRLLINASILGLNGSSLGRVGIGIDAPTEVLHIKGAGAAGMRIESAAVSFIKFFGITGGELQNEVGNLNINNLQVTTGLLSLSNGGLVRLQINPAGNVGINSTVFDATSRLWVNGIIRQAGFLNQIAFSNATGQLIAATAANMATLLGVTYIRNQVAALDAGAFRISGDCTHGALSITTAGEPVINFTRAAALIGHMGVGRSGAFLTAIAGANAMFIRGNNFPIVLSASLAGDSQVQLVPAGNLVVNYIHTLNAYKVQINSGTVTGLGLWVNGSILATDNVTAFSDRRLKSQIDAFESIGQALNKYGIKAYHYMRNDKPEIGIIAQDFEKTPFASVLGKFEKYLTVNYNGVAALALAGVAENSREIQELKSEIHSLKSKLQQHGIAA
jgi:hypothetical protein